MRVVDGRYVCSHCGTILDIPVDQREPHVVIRALGGEPNYRSLVLDGREIHRCEMTALELRSRTT